MKIRGLKSVLALSCGLLSLSVSAGAQEEKAMNLKPFADADHVIYMPTNLAAKRVPSKAGTLTNHGGGAITSPEVREALAGHTVIYLEISAAEGIRRTSGGTVRPLLAGGDPGEKFRALM